MKLEQRILENHFNVLTFLGILSIILILSSTTPYRALFNDVKFAEFYIYDICIYVCMYVCMWVCTFVRAQVLCVSSLSPTANQCESAEGRASEGVGFDMVQQDNKRPSSDQGMFRTTPFIQFGI